ncbi:fimbria/pilus periplasmic chaperone [Enterobacter asburiae]|uniref:fimbrial biogenesis chaperone n=1 Tax=Enterobacter asburiae TaxID=61645 RepID=UPI0018C288E2|nr:fimbria/pilus periplasmic chaperone [Enterobacter asburiae]MBG0640564.1 fimbria/pilus periplasmic chaperone [Enterobacter asburiae]
MPQHSSYRHIIALALFVLAIVPAQASIVITGTRVIYPAGDKEVTVKIDNQGDKPVLVQSWIDHGNPGATPETAKAPFTVTPPVNRINGGKGQMLRLIYTGEHLPANKESVFWLNVLEIPSVAKDKQNRLQVAFRSRIKIFYRPKGLAGEANKAGESVVWKKVTGGIEGFNPTPYFVSLAKITEDGEGKKIAEGTMIAPGSTTFIPVKKNLTTIYPAYINDYGGMMSVAQRITP